MILPSKHIKNCESLLGLASILLPFLNEEASVEELWRKFQKINNTSLCPTNHSFDNFVLSLDLLFILEKVALNNDKLLRI